MKEVYYDEYISQYKHQVQAELENKFQNTGSAKGLPCEYIANEQHKSLADTI